MRLPRVGAPAEERPAVRTEEGRLLDLSSVTSDIDGAFLASDGADRAPLSRLTLAVDGGMQGLRLRPAAGS